MINFAQNVKNFMNMQCYDYQNALSKKTKQLVQTVWFIFDKALKRFLETQDDYRQV